MNEKYLILERTVRADLLAIDRLYEALGTPAAGADDSQESLIVLAYRLHTLYTAFENIFRNIASAFENQIRDSAGWHRELLYRMQLDLRPIRPAVIDETAHARFAELLRFRHFFRSAYSVPLDPTRLSVALLQAAELRPLYRPQIERFLQFVQTIE